MASLNIYPIAQYLSKVISGACFGADPAQIMIVRDLVMATAKGERTINPKFFGKDRGASEKLVVDSIDLGERQGVLAVEYKENAKGYPVMLVKPTEEILSQLQEAKDEAAARFR